MAPFLNSSATTERENDRTTVAPGSKGGKTPEGYLPQVQLGKFHLERESSPQLNVITVTLDHYKQLHQVAWPVTRFSLFLLWVPRLELRFTNLQLCLRKNLKYEISTMN
jgi:hypothetical protein